LAGTELPHYTAHNPSSKTAYTTTEAAELLGISAKTLANWRWSGSPIPFAKFGRSVRYFEPDLLRYIDASRRCSTSDHGGRSDK
jgi:excisionase family DNA binding protein